jgi:hypothetical protein
MQISKANKFRKSQIRKLADLINVLNLLSFCNCGNLLICDLQSFAIFGFAICGPNFFASLKLPHNFHLSNKDLIQICTKKITTQACGRILAGFAIKRPAREPNL